MGAAGDVVGGPANPLEGGRDWSAGRGGTLDRGGVAQGVVGGAAPYPEGAPALGGGGGGGTGADELVAAGVGAPVSVGAADDAGGGV